MKTKFETKADAANYLTSKGWRQLGQSRDIYFKAELPSQRREIFRRAPSKWEVRAYG